MPNMFFTCAVNHRLNAQSASVLNTQHFDLEFAPAGESSLPIIQTIIGIIVTRKSG